MKKADLTNIGWMDGVSDEAIANLESLEDKSLEIEGKSIVMTSKFRMELANVNKQLPTLKVWRVMRALLIGALRGSWLWYQGLMNGKINPIKRAELAFQEFERVAKDESEAQGEKILDITCKVGCAFCCKYRVDVTLDEAKVLANEIKTGAVQVDLERLEKMAGWEEIADWHERPWEESKCVFLGIQNECKVYDKRPMSCRAHLVTTNPKHCESNSDKDIKYFLMPGADAFLSGVLNANGFKPLPMAVWGELNDHRDRMHDPKRMPNGEPI